jgi:hypothetical protein
MRIGFNPLRTQTMVVGMPGRVMSVITHLPDLSEYHRDRLVVIKACLLSMRHGAPDIPIMVWDNGSCSNLTEWLQNDFRPDTLILSSNVGKSNARAALFGMVSPETIMGLCDDDILFYPGWFDACQELIDVFPDVGKASCYPVRTQARWGCTNTKAWAYKNGKVSTGKIISEEEDFDFCTSIGREYQWHLGYSKQDIDYVVKYKGVEAYCFAHHCQFVAQAGTILPFCKRSNDYMADEKPFDNNVDNNGLLQLTTRKRYARHIGNIVDEKVNKELIEMGIML